MSTNEAITYAVNEIRPQIVAGSSMFFMVLFMMNKILVNVSHPIIQKGIHF
jgi:hypothetical protein